MDYLLFRLYGALASWGDIAIGESRHSFNGPTKSAVMGLVAAALGIKREEETQHLRLNRDYQMATALHNPGQLLRDYHTVQAPDTVGKFNYRSRRDELLIGRDRLGTVLSAREYRCDALAWVALRAGEDTLFSLEDITGALKAPVFTLYLGRKSCPLSAPLAPQIIAAESFSDAFEKYQPPGFSSAENSKKPDLEQVYLYGGQTTEFYWEGELADFANTAQLNKSQLLSVTQHDQLRSRQRWQFEPRTIHRYRQVGER